MSAEPIQRDYLSSVDVIQLNDKYCAALSNGVVCLHPIVGHEESEEFTFPDQQSQTKVTAIALTSNFLIYGTTITPITPLFFPLILLLCMFFLRNMELSY